MSRVLVTGGSGRLGAFVVDALAEDHEVTVFDRARPTQDVAFIQGDILDRHSVADAVEFQDAVVHLAALDADVRAADDEFMRVNVLGTWNVFDRSNSAGVKRLIHCSSVAAVNISRENPPQYLPVDTNHTCDPLEAYGLSKLLGENIARRFSTLGNMKVVCLRPTLIMQRSIAYSVAKTTAVADGTPPPPNASDASWELFEDVIPGSRSFVDPRDAAQAFKAALTCPHTAWSIFNLSSRDSYSALMTPEIVEREFGIAPEIRDEDLYEENKRASIYDIATTKQVLGWEPKHDWQDLFSDVLSEASITK